MAIQTVDADSVKRKLRFDYLKIKNDPPSKAIDLFTTILNHYYRPQLSVHDLIQDTATQIVRQLRVRWCMIGLKSRTDGLYRYEVESGMRPDAWAKQKTKQYKTEDFEIYAPNYKGGDISKITRVYLEEENPLFKEDEGVVNRPVLLRAKRKAEDETLEADFIDTLIMGPGNELLGWIEYSGTVANKFPDAMVYRYVEMIAAILALALTGHVK